MAVTSVSFSVVSHCVVQNASHNHFEIDRMHFERYTLALNVLDYNSSKDIHYVMFAQFQYGSKSVGKGYGKAPLALNKARAEPRLPTVFHVFTVLHSHNLFLTFISLSRPFIFLTG